MEGYDWQGEIKALLEKPDPTGRDIGEVQVLDLLYMFWQVLHGSSQGYSALIEGVDKMAQRLNPDNVEVDTLYYRGFCRIHDTFSVYFRSLSFHERQLAYCSSRLLQAITDATTEEDFRQYVNTFPAIVSFPQATEAAQGTYRGATNGIAVLDPPVKEGGYVDPEEPAAITGQGLQRFFPENKKCESNANRILALQEQIKDEVYYLQGYHICLKLLAEELYMPAFLQLQFPYSTDDVKAYNRKSRALKKRIAQAPYYTEEEKEKRKAVLSTVLAPVSLKGLEPPEYNINKVREGITSFTVFTGGKEGLVYLMGKRE